MTSTDIGVSEPTFGGFFVQEEDVDADADADGDATTSEGVFVYTGSDDPAINPALGDTVRVTGTVAESNGLTEITSPTIESAGTEADLPTPAEVTGPGRGLGRTRIRRRRPRRLGRARLRVLRPMAGRGRGAGRTSARPVQAHRRPALTAARGGLPRRDRASQHRRRLGTARDPLAAPLLPAPGEVDLSRLTPSATRIICAYKGHASYLSTTDGQAAGRDIAWTYPEPLDDALRVRDRIAFWNERTDIRVDGELQPGR